MKQVFRKLTVFLLVLAIILSMLPAVFAATGTPRPNSGIRDQICTELSAKAQAYYTGSYSYASLAALGGASDTSTSYNAMRNNPLYTALNRLMTLTHTNQNVKYDGYTATSLATYWKQTDTENSGSNYLYFYTDILADDPSVSSMTMNREHVWPKSRASFYQKGGGSDLHHLRPSIQGVNASKSNNAFANLNGSGSAYSVNGVPVIWTGSKDGVGGVLEVRDNVKGDVARILLYVYVRWQQPNLYSDVATNLLPEMDPDDSQNTGGRAIESLSTLLQWMQKDPVDTWEMSRNDQTENVQGNRNVFIDYPELAYLMFSWPIPKMQTPSGIAMNPDPTEPTTAPTEPTSGPTEPTSGPTEPTTGPTEPTTEPTTAPTAPRGDEYALTTTLNDGDEVVIFNAASGMAMSEDAVSINYRAGAAATVLDNCIYTDDSKLVWTVGKTADGYTFSNDAGETLSATKGLSFASTDNVWAVNPAATASSVYLVSTTSVGSSGDPRYVEWYGRYNEFSTYFYSASLEGDFAMQIFVKTGNVAPTEVTEPTEAPTEPTTAPTEPTAEPTEAPTEAPGEGFVLSSSIKAGDQVVIYNPGHGMAIANETYNDWYLIPEEITPVGDQIYSPSASLVWTVVDNGDGTYSFVNGKNAIMMWINNNYFEVTNSQDIGTDGSWKVSWTDGLAYIQHSVYSNSTGPAYLECYYNANKGTTYISGYASGDPTEKPNDYGFQFYVRSGSEIPTEPTTAPTEPTTAPTEPTTAPTQPTEPTSGPSESGYYVAESLRTNDKIVLVANYFGKHYAMTNDASTINNALLAEEVAVTDNRVDVSTTRSAGSEAVWTLAAGSAAGTYLLKSSDGKYVTYSSSGTTIRLSATGTNFSLTCGEGTSRAMITDTPTRGLFFRDNNGMQFRAYSTDNIASDNTSYCGDLTIYKYMTGVTPTEPTTAPTEPTSAPTEPTTAPTEPTSAPTEPTTAPTEPTSAPTEPTTAPTEPTTPPSSDLVAIYYPKDSKVMTTESYLYNNKKYEMVAADATLSGGKLTTSATNVALFEMITEGGYTTFKTADGKFLEADGTNVQLVSAQNDNTKFVLEPNGSDYFIKCANATYNGNPQYLEIYGGYFTVYSKSASADASIYTFNFYPLDNGTAPTEPTTAPTEPTTAPTEPTTAPTEPTTAPGGNEYVLTTSLKDGDEVIIYNASAGKAMSEDAISVNYRAGADVTVSGNKIVTIDSKIVWKVTKAANGYTFANDAGETLSATKGLSFAATDNVWAINAAKTANSVYISSTTATGTSGDAKMIEWYAKYTEFSTYYYAEASEAIFAMQLFVKDSAVTPTEPTTAPTEPTSAPTEPTTAPTEPVGDEAFVLADSIQVGDKIAFVAAYNGKYYAMTNDTSTNNALGAKEVTVTNDSVDVSTRAAGSEAVWEVVAGSKSGCYLLKSSDGKYISYGDTGTALKLADTGSNFSASCGKGTSRFMGIDSSDSDRGLSFRLPSGGVPQFRLYKTSNSTGEYSQELTIFKRTGSVAPTEPTTSPTEPTTAPGGLPFADGDCVVMYNAANGVIIGYEEDTDYDESTGSYTYINVTTEAVSVSGTTLTADFENAGTFYAIINDDGTVYFLDQYDYDQSEDPENPDCYFLAASAPDTYYDSYTDYAAFELIPVEGGYLMKNVADDSYYAVENGVIVAKSLIEGDPSFIFQFAIWEGESDSNNNIICTLVDGGTAPTEPTTAPTEPTTAPTEPTTAPTEPTTAPTEPTTAPTEPTTAPTEPTAAPTEPTTAPTEPTTAPTEPTTAPTEPTAAPTEPTTAPTEPTTAPTEPTTAPTEPTTAPTEPTTAPTEPTTAPTTPPQTEYYTITWYVNGQVRRELCAKGEIPVFTGSTDKPADEEYTYTFDGWFPSLVPANADATYTAQYIAKPIELQGTFVVTWNVDGCETTEKYNAGEIPVFTGSTDKPDDEDYVYCFAGWSPTVKKVTQNVTYTAQYKKIALRKIDGFLDVRRNMWFYDEVTRAAQLGLFNGMSYQYFEPNGDVSRAMVVTVLYRMEGTPEVELKHIFDDVTTDRWYSDAITWAYENGIAKGMSEDIFAPNEPVTREQLAAFLYRYAQYKDYDVSARGTLTGFVDRNFASEYAKNALSWAVGTDMLRGMEVDEHLCLLPRGTATRAQTASIMVRFFNTFVK